MQNSIYGLLPIIILNVHSNGDDRLHRCCGLHQETYRGIQALKAAVRLSKHYRPMNDNPYFMTVWSFFHENCPFQLGSGSHLTHSSFAHSSVPQYGISIGSTVSAGLLGVPNTDTQTTLCMTLIATGHISCRRNNLTI